MKKFMFALLAGAMVLTNVLDAKSSCNTGCCPTKDSKRIRIPKECCTKKCKPSCCKKKGCSERRPCNTCTRKGM